MFQNFNELQEIAAQNRIAVDCCTSTGGWSVQAYRSDTRAFVELTGPRDSDTRQAELSIDQFNSLKDAASWEANDAISADDVALTKAAIAWVEGHESLQWQRRGRGSHSSKMIALSAP